MGGILRLFLMVVFVIAGGIGYFVWQNPGLWQSIQQDPIKQLHDISANTLQSAYQVGKNTTSMNDIFSKFNLLGQQVQNKTSSPEQQVAGEQTSVPVVSAAPVLLRFALVADSHSDNNHLRQALERAKQQGVRLVIGLGDYSQVGTLRELADAKAVFDASGLTYYVLPGDHDLWDARDKEKPKATANFEAIFGKPYRSFTESGIQFILVDNSDNYTGLSEEQMTWLKGELKSRRAHSASSGQVKRVEEYKRESTPALPLSSSPALTFVFLHEPLYHPESQHIMGRVNDGLKSQVEELLTLFAANNVAHVFAGDIHFFAQFTEPKHHVTMTTVGAVTQERNIQTPRFAIVTIHQDGKWEVADEEIKN